MTIKIDAIGLEEELLEQAAQIIKETKKEQNTTRDPKLVIITATDDEASFRYVYNKIKACKKFGIEVVNIKLDKSVTQEELEEIIQKLNEDNGVDAIILQLPIYDHLDKDILINMIDMDKDVDGLTLINKGFLEDNKITFMPCTPLGVIFLLRHHDINTETDLIGKNVVVIGRGETAGAPMSVAFRHLDANVTLLHSKTSAEDLEFYVRHADVVISCVGKRFLLKADWFKKDSIVIGVGFTYDDKGKQHLDFEADAVVAVGNARFVTNRINSTGKATVLGLIANTLEAYRNTEI